MTTLELLGVTVAREETVLLGADMELWHATLPESLPEAAMMQWLSRAERARVGALRIPTRAATAAWSRLLMRSVVARELGCGAGEVPIVESARGKPQLPPVGGAGVDSPPRGAELHFNVSHSGRQWMAAVTRAHPVGVDIEARRELRDAERLARKAFGADELLEYHEGLEQGLSASDAFLRVWTSVEARSKALGTGIDRHGAKAVVGLSGLPWCEVPVVARAGERFVGAVAVRQ
jgi:4'-phosphopantetheinyl transferase